VIYDAQSLQVLVRGFAGRARGLPLYNPVKPLLLSDPGCDPAQALPSTDEYGLVLWDANTGEDIGTIGWRLVCGAWFPNGEGFYGIGDGHIEVWQLDPEIWIAAACRLAGRNLTQAEWERYGVRGEPLPRTCP
jgi:hypothetical protein